MIRLIWLGTILFTLASCHKAENQQSEKFLQAQQELTRKLTEVSKTVGVKGFGVALVNDKEVLYQNGFGLANSETNQPYDQNTVQNIASVSKTFIGIALLKAHELGKLKLDDPVNKYLSFQVNNPYYPDIPITIRQLATHTSSINDTEQYLTKTIVLKDTANLVHNLKINISPTKFNPPSARMPMEEFLNNVLNKKGKWYPKDGFLNKRPGAIFNYSNVGATLAALVVEKATDISYDQFTTTYILKPLKMTASGWHFNAIDFSNYTHTFQNKATPYPYYSLNTYPDGGMLTSSRDMSNYILELMKGYFGHGTLLSKESYKEYFRPQLKEENFIGRSVGEYSDEYNMGITIGFGSTGNFGHTGGDPGVSSGIWFFKDKKMGRYLIVNTDWDPKTMGKDQIAIYSLLAEYFKKLDQLSHSN